jgi:DNA-binding XRE family transcriptional regulator
MSSGSCGRFVRRSLLDVVCSGRLLRVIVASRGTLGGRLRASRQEAGLTQAELARKARTSRIYLSFLETGRRASPSLGVLRRLARALGVTLAELVE